MSLTTRDARVYPLAGIDVVPQYPKKPPALTRIGELTTLLREANRREEELKGTVEHWQKKYQALYQEHVALKYGDTCRECQTLRDTTPPGDTLTLCPDCSEGKVSLRSLQLQLEKKQEEVRY